jgi:integrase
MEWNEINFNTNIWEIPADKMKMKKPHLVPLSNQAIKLLKEVQQYNGSNKYVFESSISKRPLSENTLNLALKRIGFGDKIVSHGFRHLASTLLNENKKAIGSDSEVIEIQLAHTHNNKIKATYDHAQYLDERIHMMQFWSDYLDSLKNAS